MNLDDLADKKSSPCANEFDTSTDPHSNSSTTATTEATWTVTDAKHQDEDDEFGEFGNDDDAHDDDFGEFDEFHSTTDFDLHNDDDDFDDFTTFEDQEEPPSKPATEAEEYVKVLDSAQTPKDVACHLEHVLSRIWSEPTIDDARIVRSPSPIESANKILCTPCSEDLWEKLSRDSVFYNPITGSIGQFQWTRSETNRAYLNALGVIINYEEKSLPRSTGSPMMSSKRPQSNYLEGNKSPLSGAEKYISPSHVRSASLSGVNVKAPAIDSAFPAGAAADMTDRRHSDDDIDSAKRAPAEEEPQLDIDIARAYCELTEETIRIFPDEKLKSMVVELSRLQRQASEYLSYLLDQREQLMMDAETYNDLISCIVGHAQRLREQNVGKDASPAMVSKKKKTGGSLNMLRRKQNSASLGGGVVGVKQGGPTGTTTAMGQKKPMSAPPAEGRRSL
ncbi:hypothetical protein BX666DRAFT_2047547 [Dichotomocladium elegans]|nr:hypothetical protein BX666DRAFT_2047547 [Dichotomocladium elegans]